MASATENSLFSHTQNCGKIVAANIVIQVKDMAKHEFGIMDTAPIPEQTYNNYGPEKYHCISVEDKDIEPLLKDFSEILCYWHSLKREEYGLAYCGISIIPPQSLKNFISIIDNKTQFHELRDLLQKALQENKFVIHFGI